MLDWLEYSATTANALILSLERLIRGRTVAVVLRGALSREECRAAAKAVLDADGLRAHSTVAGLRTLGLPFYEVIGEGRRVEDYFAYNPQYELDRKILQGRLR